MALRPNMDWFVPSDALSVECFPIHKFVYKVGFLFPLVVSIRVTMLEVGPYHLEPEFAVVSHSEVLEILQSAELGCFGELFQEFRIPSGEREHGTVALTQKYVPKPMLLRLGRRAFTAAGSVFAKNDRIKHRGGRYWKFRRTHKHIANGCLDRVCDGFHIGIPFARMAVAP